MEQTKEIVVRNITDRYTDSIEIGTPSKGGAIKVYGDANKENEFQERIDSMLKLRNYLKEQIDKQNEPKKTD